MSNESKRIHEVGFVVLLALAASLCFLNAACQDSVSYTPILRPSRPLVSRPVGSVEVFAVTPPARPHTDIGILQVGDKLFSDQTMADLIEVARQNAATLGCDAILVTSIDRMTGRSRRPNIQASCIVYNDPPPSSALVPPSPRSP